MKINVAKFLSDTRQVVSMSQGRRAVCMGAIEINGEKITDITTEVEVEIGDVIKIGKREITITQEMLRL